MTPLRNVLVATDLSPQADEAVRQADELARANGATLIALHTVPRAIQANPLFPERNLGEALLAPALLEAAGDAVERRVSELTGRAPAAFRIVVDHGAPTASILQHIDEMAVDLAVVASHGPSRLRRALLGSVAERVVRYAPCATLVARPSPMSGKVLAATDFSDPALPAVERAASEAARRGAHLTVLHSLGVAQGDLTGSLTPLGASPVRVPKDVLESARATAMDLLEKSVARLGAAADPLVTTGEASDDIVETATRLAAELVVVGRQGRTGLARVALGSVAEAVIQRAACSVWVVPTGSP